MNDNKTSLATALWGLIVLVFLALTFFYTGKAIAGIALLLGAPWSYLFIAAGMFALATIAAKIGRWTERETDAA